MLATYRALLARWTVVGWRRVRVLDHGHTGGAFKVRKVGSRVTGALKALRDMAVASRLVKFSRVVRWGGVALISVVSIFLVVVAISKRRFQDEVIRSNEVSIRILAEKKLGRIARANGELEKAKQHFQNAADLGDEHSRKILRLMSQCEK